MGLGNFIPMSNLSISPPIKTQFRSFEYHGPKTEDGLALPPSSNIGKKRVYHERSDSSFTVEQNGPPKGYQNRHREQRHKKIVADNML